MKNLKCAVTKDLGIVVIAILMMIFSGEQAVGQDWKPAAEDSILKYRTAPLTINVVDNNGQPVEGVSVHVKLLNHAFKWGTTVNVNEVSRILGSNNSFNISSNYLNHFLLFNSVTPDNAGKWKGWIDPSQRTTYLKIISWLESEGIANRGHTCVWESERFNAIPDMLIGQTDTSIVRKEVHDHIKNIMSTLSGKIYEMDVVNELIHEQHIVNDLLHAPDRALEHSRWYKWAKQAAPDVDLIANEFNLFQSGGDFYKRFISYVQKMMDDGAPVDGVGMQGHFWSAMPSYNELKRRIENVKPLGLPMAVTEFDMVGKSYTDMERVMYAVFSEPQIYGFTVWGAWDGSQWRKNGALFEENWELKPSGQAWLDLVHGKWKTDAELVSDASGKAQLNAFKGMHLIILERDGKVVSDTIEVNDTAVEFTYNSGTISSAVPEAKLKIAGGKNEFNIFQPAVLNVETTQPDSILKVEYFEGLFMRYRDTQPDFQYELISTAATSKSIFARVHCKNGVVFNTDTISLNFVNANAFPNISEVYPYNNQVFIYGQDVDVYCNATDYEDQMWKVELSGLPGDTILTDATKPYHFNLEGLTPGIYRLELKALDSLYGFGTKKLTFSVLDPDEQNVSVSSPKLADEDVEQLADGSIETEGDLDMGEKITGIRFKNINLPKNIQIDSVYIQFTVDKGNQGYIRFAIQAEDLANAAAFRTSVNDLSSRTELTEPIWWEPSDWNDIGDRKTAQRTPDLKPIIESLISLEEWSESSPVNFIFGLAEEDNKRRAKSVDIQEDAAPELKIYYQTDFDVSPPDAPTGLQISEKTGNQVTVQWTASPGNIQCYFVYVDGEKYDVFGTKGTTFTIDFPDQEKHEIYVTAMNGYSMESEPGNSVFTDDAVVGVFQLNSGNDLRVYPNPFSDELIIKTGPGFSIEKAEIINIFGQKVYNFNAVEEGCELFWNGKDSRNTQLSDGIYFLKVFSGGKQFSKKIIKKQQ